MGDSAKLRRGITSALGYCIGPTLPDSYVVPNWQGLFCFLFAHSPLVIQRSMSHNTRPQTRQKATGPLSMGLDTRRLLIWSNKLPEFCFFVKAERQPFLILCFFSKTNFCLLLFFRLNNKSYPIAEIPTCRRGEQLACQNASIDTPKRAWSRDSDHAFFFLLLPQPRYDPAMNPTPMALIATLGRWSTRALEFRSSTPILHRDRRACNVPRYGILSLYLFNWTPQCSSANQYTTIHCQLYYDLFHLLSARKLCHVQVTKLLVMKDGLLMYHGRSGWTHPLWRHAARCTPQLRHYLIPPLPFEICDNSEAAVQLEIAVRQRAETLLFRLRLRLGVN